MLDFKLFASRNFAMGNVATAAIYAGLSAFTFVLTVYLQQVSGYTATASGLALLPVTVLMFLLSPVSGRLAGKHGPRWFMTFGPLIAAAGFLLMLRMHAHAAYFTEVLPGILMFGLGLACTVSPLTAAILGGIDQRHAGIERRERAFLLQAKVRPLVTAVPKERERLHPILAGASVQALHGGLWAMAGALAVGGLISAAGIRNPKRQ